MAHLLDTFRFADHCVTKNKVVGNKFRFFGENESPQVQTQVNRARLVLVREEEYMQHTQHKNETYGQSSQRRKS
jgi:hypothetical protein